MTGPSRRTAEAAPSEESAESSESATQESPGRKSSAAPPVTWSEEQLNAPSRQTVGMLALVATATLAMWAAGRAACNYHEPGESLSPKVVALEARTRTEKDVAFELSQSRAAGDYDTAAQLVTGDLAKVIEEERKTCGGQDCAARREAKERIFSVATLLQRGGTAAHVRVRTVGAPGGEVTKLYEVERIGPAWKVSRELPVDGPLPPLPDPAPVLLRPAPVPSEGPAPEGAAPRPEPSQPAPASPTPTSPTPPSASPAAPSPAPAPAAPRTAPQPAPPSAPQSAPAPAPQPAP